MTGGVCSVAVDTADLPAYCSCGCVHCCVNRESPQTALICKELKEARPLSLKHQFLQYPNVPVKEPIHAETHTTRKETDAEKRTGTWRNRVNESVKECPITKQGFQCDLCKTVFTRKYSLTVHLRRHTCQQNQENDVAHRVTASEQKESDKATDKHMPSTLKYNEQEASKGISLHCGICATSFQTAASLYNHIQGAHQGAPGVVDHLGNLATANLALCNTCGKAFSCQSVLAAHSLVHSGVCDYTCNICKRHFPTPASLCKHSTMHKRLKSFRCALCGAAFTKKDSLSTHLRKHSGERPFRCDVCAASFDRRFTLKNHRILHSRERPHVCATCGKAFPTRGALTAHERSSHSKTEQWQPLSKIKKDFQPAVCEHCGKVYSNAANLRIHKRTHSGARPFQCPVCGAAFAKKYTLECHVRRHTGERPFVCSDCGASFFRQSTLATHRRRHTGERPHCCKLCGRGFIQSASLVYHLKHHDHTEGCQRSTGSHPPPRE